jgi:bacteriocin-like protein
MAESTKGPQDTAVPEPGKSVEPSNAAVPKREENELSDNELDRVSGGIADVSAGLIPRAISTPTA